MFKIKNNCPVKIKCIILTKRRNTRILINQIWKDFNQKDLWSNLQENTMLKDIRKDQIQPCRRKKTVSPYICRIFLENTNHWMEISVLQKHQSLAGWYSKNKTAIPACIYLLIKFHRIYHFLSARIRYNGDINTNKITSTYKLYLSWTVIHDQLRQPVSSAVWIFRK